MASLESSCELFWCLREGYIQPSEVDFPSPLSIYTSLEESPSGITESQRRPTFWYPGYGNWCLKGEQNFGDSGYRA